MSTKLGRRLLLLPLVLLPPASIVSPSPAAADIIDFARAFYRPDIDVETALVRMLDARSTLLELEALASTPMDSDERFHSRALLPGMAARLRDVGEAAPLVARLITGSTDKEETLSSYYGGKAEDGAAITDQVYFSLGRVLTISGRTIRPEALASPEPAKEATESISQLLDRVPEGDLSKAQAFRVARANGQTTG